MIDILDKKTLENRFANNFGSPLFPILADMYLAEGDIRRARKVCEVGLDHDSNNIDGKFVFAQVAVAEKKFAVAEKLLKQVVDENPINFNGLRMLIDLEIKLKRSPKTIQKYINRILHFLPHDPECLGWADGLQNTNDISSKQNANYAVAMPEEATSDAVKTNKGPHPLKNQTYNVDMSMATFTMVQVLKSQKHYHQALSVLEALESAGQDKNKIDHEKGIVLQCISESK